MILPRSDIFLFDQTMHLDNALTMNHGNNRFLRHYTSSLTGGSGNQLIMFHRVLTFVHTIDCVRIHIQHQGKGEMIIKFQRAIVFPIEAKTFDLNAQHRWEFLDTQSFDGRSFLLTFLTKILGRKRTENDSFQVSLSINEISAYCIVPVQQFTFHELIQ